MRTQDSAAQRVSPNRPERALGCDRRPDLDGVDAPDLVVKDTFRELAKEAHGDQGGSDEWVVTELKRARDELLE